METGMENLYVDSGVETRAGVVTVNFGQNYYFTSIRFTKYVSNSFKTHTGLLHTVLFA